MQKTFCDRCGEQCTGFHLDLHGCGYVTTNNGEVLEELFATKRGLQLCRRCTDILRDFGIDFGLITEAEAQQAKQDRTEGENMPGERIEWTRASEARAHP